MFNILQLSGVATILLPVCPGKSAAHHFWGTPSAKAALLPLHQISPRLDTASKGVMVKHYYSGPSGPSTKSVA